MIYTHTYDYMSILVHNYVYYVFVNNNIIYYIHPQTTSTIAWTA